MPDILITPNGDILDEYESGIDYLVGLVEDNIVNGVLSDLYSPSFGTSIKTLPRFNTGSEKEIKMKIQLLIEEVETKIKNEQINSPADASETLSNLIVKDVYQYFNKDKNSYFWACLTEVISVSGETAFLETKL